MNVCCAADRGVAPTMPTCVVPIATGFPPISGLTTPVFDALAMYVLDKMFPSLDPAVLLTTNRHLSKMNLCGYSNVGDQNIYTDWQLASGYLK